MAWFCVISFFRVFQTFLHTTTDCNQIITGHFMNKNAATVPRYRCYAAWVNSPIAHNVSKSDTTL